MSFPGSSSFCSNKAIFCGFTVGRTKRNGAGDKLDGLLPISSPRSRPGRRCCDRDWMARMVGVHAYATRLLHAQQRARQGKRTLDLGDCWAKRLGSYIVLLCRDMVGWQHSLLVSRHEGFWAVEAARVATRISCRDRVPFGTRLVR